MLQQMQINARKAILPNLPQKTGAGDIRIDIAPGALAAVIWIPAPAPEGFFELLRRNGTHRQSSPVAPVVIDPQVGKPALRLVVPLAVWSSKPNLEKFVSERWQPAAGPPEFFKLRLLRNVPEGQMHRRYGRSERLCIRLDQHLPLITAAVFPGAMLEARASLSSRRLELASRILLARSGGSSDPRSFHMLERSSFASLSRALEVYDDAPHQWLRAAERKLLQQAEEDRKLLLALTDPDLSLETLEQMTGSND